MARMKGKGTVVKATIATVLTAIPGIISIDVSGEESETEEIRVLDGGAPLEMDSTGFVKARAWTLELYYDAANSVHAFLKTSMRTPVNVVCTLTYTDAGPVTETQTCTGIAWSEKVESSGRVKATCKLQMSGAVS